MFDYIDLLDKQQIWSCLLHNEEEIDFIKGVPSLMRLIHLIYFSYKHHKLKTENANLNCILLRLMIYDHHLIILNKNGELYLVTLDNYSLEKVILNIDDYSILESINILDTLFQSFDLNNEAWQQFINRLTEESHELVSHSYELVKWNHQGIGQYDHSRYSYYLINGLWIFYLLEPLILLEESKYSNNDFSQMTDSPLSLYFEDLLIEFNISPASSLKYSKKYRKMEIISDDDILPIFLHEDICYNKSEGLVLNISNLFDH